MAFNPNVIIVFIKRFGRQMALVGLLPAILMGIASYAYINHEGKSYDATLTLYVQQALPPTTAGAPAPQDIPGSTNLAHTYSEMITEPIIVADVDRAMSQEYPGYRLERHQLRSSQAATIQQGTSFGTQLVEVTVADNIPARAQAAVTAVAHSFIGRVDRLERARFAADSASLHRQLLSAKASLDRVTAEIAQGRVDPITLRSLQQQQAAYQDTYRSILTAAEQFAILRDSSINNVAIYSPAAVVVTGPHPLRLGVILAVLVFLLGCGGVYLNDLRKDLARSPDEIEEMLGAPIVGSVPKFDTNRSGGALITAKEPRSALAESYRLIRTNIQFTNIDNPPRVIVVTSPLPRDGKSTTSANLAEVFAQSGVRVALVDADLRKPTLQQIFPSGPRRGLTNMLLGDLNGSTGAAETIMPNLSVILTGPLPPNPADLLGTHRMRELVAALREAYDIVIIDSPPVIPVADAALLSTIADGVIIVVDPAQTRTRDMQRARESITGVSGKILGVVVNRLTRRGSGAYYYYYSQYYSTYGYGYADVSGEAGDAARGSGTGKRADQSKEPATTDRH